MTTRKKQILIWLIFASYVIANITIVQFYPLLTGIATLIGILLIFRLGKEQKRDQLPPYQTFDNQTNAPKSTD